MEGSVYRLCKAIASRFLAGRPKTGGPGIAPLLTGEGVMCASEQSLQSTPQKFVYCEETRDLLDRFSEAAKELLDLHKQQLLGIIVGDPDVQRFDLLIHLANEKKQQAK